MDNSDENSIVKWYVYMKSFFSSFIFMFFFCYDFLVWHFGLLFFCSQVRQKLSYGWCIQLLHFSSSLLDFLSSIHTGLFMVQSFELKWDIFWKEICTIDFYWLCFLIIVFLLSFANEFKFIPLILFRGKMGASLNRLYKQQAIGCKPPFLVVQNLWNSCISLVRHISISVWDLT